MLGRVITEFNRSKLDTAKSVKYKGDFKSLYDLVQYFGRRKSYIVFTSKYGRKEVGYVHDIRFDYVHGRVFVPIFVYKYLDIDPFMYPRFKKTKAYEKTDTMEVIYKQTLQIFEIWNSRQGYVVEDITVVDKNILGVSRFYEINISKLPIRDNIVEEDISVLFFKYIKSFLSSDKDEELLYYSTKKMYLTQMEKKILEENNLEWYNYENWKDLISYRDVRTYKYSDIEGKFTEEEVSFKDNFYLRIIDFESYLMGHLINHVYWKGLDFNPLISGKYFYLKYKDRGISLILKSKWLEPYKLIKE